MSRTSFLAAAYVAVGLCTFGYAADRREQANATRYSECVAAQAYAEYRTICGQDEMPSVIAGIGAGLAWPLYLSWVAAERLRGLDPAGLAVDFE